MSEIDILKDVVSRLNKLNIDYMISGSVAMNFYTIPRMTRDIDIIIVINIDDVERIFLEFKDDYYIDKESIEYAIKDSSMFNIIHLEEVLKIDFIIRKNNEYRLLEFNNRKRVNLDGIEAFLVSVEDLIISKLLWARDSFSEIQIRDIKGLLKCNVNKEYINNWVKKLRLEEIFKKVIE